ncbi:MAG: hypothetical protein P8171_06915 [Candidatus Thiodiazotropha sp.]
MESNKKRLLNAGNGIIGFMIENVVLLVFHSFWFKCELQLIDIKKDMLLSGEAWDWSARIQDVEKIARIACDYQLQW